MSEKTMHLRVLSPDGVVFEGEVSKIIAPTSNGQITVLPDHAPLLTKIEEGEIIITRGKGGTFIALTGGFFSIAKNRAEILANYAVRAESIEVAQVLEAKARAEEALRAKKDMFDFLAANHELMRSIFELNIADKVRKRNRR
jgi:F-type H+-transporting ATPase subunit epsilon